VRPGAMSVPREPSLLMNNSERHGIGRIKAVYDGVLVTDVIGNDQVLLQVQKNGVAPEWRMVFLIVKQNTPRGRDPVRRAAEVRHIGDALFLVADQVVQHMNIFS